jgi:hypothetical protein
VERVDVRINPVGDTMSPTTLQMNSVSTVNELVVQIEFMYGMQVEKLEQSGVVVKKTKQLKKMLNGAKQIEVDVYMSKKESSIKAKKQKKKL